MEIRSQRNRKKAAIIPPFAAYSIDLQPVPRLCQPLVRLARYSQRTAPWGRSNVRQTTREENMKQLFAVLVAAMFAATSFAALAQDKGSKMDKKSDKKKSAKRDGKKKSAKSDKMDKMDKK